MPKYLSKEADGSVIEFDAEHISHAFLNIQERDALQNYIQ